MTIIIMPYSAMDNRDEVDRQLAAIVENEPIQFDDQAPVSLHIKPFIEANREALLTMAAQERKRQGRGMIYIHDRLDEPAPDYPPGYSIDPHKSAKVYMIGGYQAIFINATQLRRINMGNIAKMIENQLRINQQIVHCRVAHHADPERLDQPHLARIE